MDELSGRNVNEVWPQALRMIMYGGVRRSSRNGMVREMPGPVVTTYERPQERVLFDNLRDANPFFHLFESLWILAGRNDVAFPAQFAKQLSEYSDDGKTFRGAYGHRLRHAGSDQLDRAVEILKHDPTSRRVVLSIWDAKGDLGVDSKDVPCNTTIFVKVRDGSLLLTVCNRSNDIVWGLYGANVVQWSMLQEYLASRIGVAMGPLTTISDSFHMYESNHVWAALEKMKIVNALADPYTSRHVCPYPLMDVPHLFDKELHEFLNDPLDDLGEMFVKDRRNSFLWAVAQPMYRAWQAHKENKNGAHYLLACEATDWRHAGIKWLDRRGDRLTPKQQEVAYAGI